MFSSTKGFSLTACPVMPAFSIISAKAARLHEDDRTTYACPARVFERPARTALQCPGSLAQHTTLDRPRRGAVLRKTADWSESNRTEHPPLHATADDQ